MPGTSSARRWSGSTNIAFVGVATPSRADMSGANCAWCTSARKGEPIAHTRLLYAEVSSLVSPLRHEAVCAAPLLHKESGEDDTPAPHKTYSVLVHSGEASPWLAWSVILQMAQEPRRSVPDWISPSQCNLHGSNDRDVLKVLLQPQGNSVSVASRLNRRQIVGGAAAAALTLSGDE